MRRRHDSADARLAFGNGWKRDAGSHHAFFKQLAREVHRQLAVANDDGGDWRFTGGRVDAADVEAEPAKLFLPVTRVLPQLVDAFGLLLQHVERSDTRCGDRWRMRC